MSVSIYHKGDLSIINCFNFYSSIFIYNVYLIRAQPTGGKFAFEGFELGIKQQVPITRLQVFLFNKLIMPLAPLVLDQYCPLDGMLPDFIQLIQM
jgi:hypothetical protein